MHRWLFICCLVLPILGYAQLLQTPYSILRPDLPEWVNMMYTNKVDPVQLKEAFDTYYKNHFFEKDQFTQYYKRWQRQIARRPYWIGMNDVEKRNFLISKKNYLRSSKQNIYHRDSNSIWQCIGPFDFDKNAASTSYACGAAHVYTIEKAKTNTDILYAGTATAGVWKTIDKGKNWNLTTSGEWITSVRAIEIYNTNEQIVYAA